MLQWRNPYKRSASQTSVVYSLVGKHAVLYLISLSTVWKTVCLSIFMRSRDTIRFTKHSALGRDTLNLWACQILFDTHHKGLGFFKDGINLS